MTYEMELLVRHNDGIREGIAIGRKEGLRQGLKQGQAAGSQLRAQNSLIHVTGTNTSQCNC
jgi:flagellar biosynthesis/type III secretory pathway protein FliH